MITVMTTAMGITTMDELGGPGTLHLLHLLRLVSPALPVGAYSYSRGLEYAVHSGAVTDEDSARTWICGVAARSLCSLDVPVLGRLMDAWEAGEEPAVRRWNDYLFASRESRELQLEEAQMGAALARLLRDLGVERAAPWVRESRGGYPTMFALAASHHGIGVRQAQAGYVYAWVESQASAAMRLVPLGQTSGQRILSAAIEAMPAWLTAAAQCPDDALGNLAPGLAMMSARHETQYSRLFRS